MGAEDVEEAPEAAGQRESVSVVQVVNDRSERPSSCDERAPSKTSAWAKGSPRRMLGGSHG